MTSLAEPSTGAVGWVLSPAGLTAASVVLATLGLLVMSPQMRWPNRGAGSADSGRDQDAGGFDEFWADVKDFASDQFDVGGSIVDSDLELRSSPRPGVGPARMQQQLVDLVGVVDQLGERLAWLQRQPLTAEATLAASAMAAAHDQIEAASVQATELKAFVDNEIATLMAVSARPTPEDEVGAIGEGQLVVWLPNDRDGDPT